MRRLFVLMCLCLVSPLFAQNLIVNPDFETGTTDGWGVRGGGGNIQVITDNPHSGQNCLRISGRTQVYQGALQSQNMRGVTEVGKTYYVEAWIRTNRADTTPVKLSMQYNTDPVVYDSIVTNVWVGTEWTLISGTYEMLDNGSTEATFYLEGNSDYTAGGNPLAAAEDEIYIDDVVFMDAALRGIPYDPQVEPENPDGSVGTLFEVSPTVYEIRDLVLSFKAGPDPTGENAVNPAIHHHLVYLQSGLPNDESLILIDSPLPQESLEDPLQSLTLADVDIALQQDTTYQWQVQMIMQDSQGNPYPEGDPNHIMGPIWSFTTVGAGPRILSISDHQLTDASGAATLTVVADELADNYRWFKVVGVQDTEGGEADDTPLTDGGMYLGTTTDTLSISGMSANGSDDARYYAVAYNGDPEGTGFASEPSEERWVWYPRLVSHYKFTSTDGGIIADTISGYDAQIMSGNGSVLPDLAVNAPAGLAGLGRITSLPFTAASQHYLQVDEQYAATFKDLTVSMWFKTTGTSSYQRIFDYGNGQGNSTFICPHYNGVGRAAFSVDVPDHGERRVESALDAVVNNVWTHITATLSGNTARLFINGEWVNMSAEFLYPPVDNGATIQNWIGRSQYGSDPYFSGNIADLKVWNYALTNEEVAWEYLNDTTTPSEGYVCDREVFRGFQTMDSNDNCMIDLEDLAKLAGSWMESRLLYAD
mgnify:FL=1